MSDAMDSGGEASGCCGISNVIADVIIFSSK